MIRYRYFQYISQISNIIIVYKVDLNASTIIRIRINRSGRHVSSESFEMYDKLRFSGSYRIITNKEFNDFLEI